MKQEIEDQKFNNKLFDKQVQEKQQLMKAFTSEQEALTSWISELIKKEQK